MQTHLLIILKVNLTEWSPVRKKNARSRVGSFKVTAECNNIGEMYTPELRPERALIRHYYEPRKASVVGLCSVPSEREANMPISRQPTGMKMSIRVLSYKCRSLRLGQSAGDKA